MTAKYDTQRPYAASYLLFRKDNQAAFLLRQHTSWMNDHYGLVAGKVEQGESFTQAAIREAAEEAGVTLTAEQLKPVLLCHRNEPDEAMVWVDMVYEVTDWQGELSNAEPHMHAKLEWLELANLPANVISSVAAMIEAYQNGQTYLEYGWS